MRPLWAAVLVKCRFFCSQVCRISNYGDSRSIWHDLWCCGCLWSGLLPFIHILINILCLREDLGLSFVLPRQTEGCWMKRSQSKETFLQVSLLGLEIIHRTGSYTPMCCPCPFIQILSRLFKNSFYPNFIQILSYFFLNLDKIWIKLEKTLFQIFSWFIWIKFG